MFVTAYTVSMGTEAAGIYIYTSDSPFNQISMSDYMSEGIPITPLMSETQFGTFHNISFGDASNTSIVDN